MYNSMKRDRCSHQKMVMPMSNSAGFFILKSRAFGFFLKGWAIGLKLNLSLRSS